MRQVIIGFMAIISTACLSNLAESKEAHFTVEQFMKNAQFLKGKVITIRGFISPLYPQISVATDESFDLDRSVYVMDLTLRERGGYDRGRNGEALLLERIGCIPKFGDITGEVGKTASGTIGITRIHGIRVYLDGNFNGQGTVCYEMTS